MLVNDSTPFCTDFDPTVSYLDVAKAFGLQCQRLERHEDIRSVLEKAMAHNGPSFIEMPVVSEDVIAPFVPKWVSGAKRKTVLLCINCLTKVRDMPVLVIDSSSCRTGILNNKEISWAILMSTGC